MVAMLVWFFRTGNKVGTRDAFSKMISRVLRGFGKKYLVAGT